MNAQWIKEKKMNAAALKAITNKIFATIDFHPNSSSMSCKNVPLSHIGQINWYSLKMN